MSRAALLTVLLCCAACAREKRKLELSVTGKGFEPSTLSVTKGQPLELKVTRTTDETCATELLIEGTDINVPLPLDQPVLVEWTPSKSGDVKYGCAMGMMIGGILKVD
jgi:plastocyanin domain-containing protein